MKQLNALILPLLLSPPAFALEVGEIVKVPRSDIQCTERVIPENPGCGHTHYCYGNTADQVVATASIRRSVDGINNLAAGVASCGSLSQLLDRVGDPAALEVTQVITRKLPNGGTIRYLDLVLGSNATEQVTFHGHKQ